jgi:hypothetical protein
MEVTNVGYKVRRKIFVKTGFIVFFFCSSVIANKLGAKFKGLDNKMMSSHKRILSKNFWIDRTSEE